METVCLRLDKNTSKEIERDLKKFKYATKTEFIRDAIRSKLKELEEEKQKKKEWNALFSMRGILKGKGKAKTDKEWLKLKRETGEEFFEEMKKKFNQK